MTKNAGAACPGCNRLPCAEFCELGKTPQWKCLGCQAEGALSGAFTAREVKAAPASAPGQAKKPWPFPTTGGQPKAGAQGNPSNLALPRGVSP